MHDGAVIFTLRHYLHLSLSLQAERFGDSFVFEELLTEELKGTISQAVINTFATHVSI